MRVLVTGGAGFIGAHVSNELLKRGHSVRALDSLVPQVHGPERKRPSYLSRDVELMIGDIRNADIVTRALERIDAVIHFAALASVANSVADPSPYYDVNMPRRPSWLRPRPLAQRSLTC